MFGLVSTDKLIGVSLAAHGVRILAERSMNVDLLLLKAEIENEIRDIAHREETLRSHLTNLQSVVSFLHRNQHISQKCQVEKDGSNPFDSNGDFRSAVAKGIGIQVCPHCEIKVLPTKDGRCPSCQIQFPLD
jgi:hypothetical protein